MKNLRLHQEDPEKTNKIKRIGAQRHREIVETLLKMVKMPVRLMEKRLKMENQVEPEEIERSLQWMAVIRKKRLKLQLATRETKKEARTAISLRKSLQKNSFIDRNWIKRKRKCLTNILLLHQSVFSTRDLLSINLENGVALETIYLLLLRLLFLPSLKSHFKSLTMPSIILRLLRLRNKLKLCKKVLKTYRPSSIRRAQI